MMIIGHRGAMGHAPENTLASFQKALDLDVDAIELDVMLSKTGEVMVFHDDRLERVSDGTGYLSDHSFEELRRLDVGEGQIIPTLEEAMDSIGGRVTLNVELKNVAVTPPVMNIITEKVKIGSWSLDQILISSFDHFALRTAKELIPEINIGTLISIIPLERAKMALDMGAFSINPCLDFIDKALVNDAHENGLKVFVWTVNHEKDAQKMMDLGVDGIFTNYPDIVKNA